MSSNSSRRKRSSSRCSERQVYESCRDTAGGAGGMGRIQSARCKQRQHKRRSRGAVHSDCMRSAVTVQDEEAGQCSEWNMYQNITSRSSRQGRK
jgi:hypothetical protein